jgi:hypothetical protein
MRTNHRRNRRAFAATVAVVMIGLIGATLLAMSGIFAIEARRARTESTDAQLRQLLLAGTAHAAQAVVSAPPASVAKPINLALPELLTQQDARLTLTLTPPKGSELRVAIEASLARRTLRQTLLFTNTAGTWQLTSATLGESSTDAPTPPAPAAK